MSKINEAKNKIKRVEHLFDEISDKCLNLIKYVKDNKYTEKSKIVQTLCETCEIDDDQALSIVLTTCNLLAQDAIDFLEQKDNFNILTIDQDFEDCQFIAEIWSGDAYGVTEIEGLDAFRRDIEDQYLTLTNPENLLRKCQTEYLKLA